MKKPFYSIGIIFKNEIRCLERCLKSLQPLRNAVPCELVMADTGSSDGSREVAERYADILFDFPWVDDFSAARNAVMDRCSGAWYLSIDADEWLAENIDELVLLSKDQKQPLNFGGVTLRNYKSFDLEKGQNYVEFVAVRLLRMSTGIHYKGCIHESWSNPDGSTLEIMTLSKTMFYHDGYIYEDKAAEQAKRERNMALLKKKLRENPNHLQTLIECVDSSKHHGIESAEYARQSVELVGQKCPTWDRFGGVVFRNAVSVAQLHQLPEMEEWIRQGVACFPDSIFVRVDLAYYAFVYYFDEKKYNEAAYWGEAYCKGLADYFAGNYNTSESTRGVLEFASPFWERKISVLLPQVYLELNEPEKALAGIRNVKGGELEDDRQIELCVNMLMRIQRTTQLDAAAVVNAFWNQINLPFPDKAMAEKRRIEFLRVAANALTKNYRDDELTREEFKRHSYTVFHSLIDHKDCELGTAVVALETDDQAELERLLDSVENWNEFSIYALEHAILGGVRFPLASKALNIEEMDVFAARMSRKDSPLVGLAILAAEEDLAENWQSLAWARGLALAAVKTCDWVDSKQGMELCQAFAKIENMFLPRYYAPELLCDENIRMLPPMHRFGWYCGKAFWALDAGDPAEYVRLLRKGLDICPEMKSMVEFLLTQLEESQRVQATPELLSLAEQVRTLLSMYPADDPAVEALKQSAAYQKVAHLIEGPDLGVFGGLPQ